MMSTRLARSVLTNLHHASPKAINNTSISHHQIRSITLKSDAPPPPRSPSDDAPTPADPHPYLSQMRIHPVARGSTTSSAGPFPMPDAPSREDTIRNASRSWKKLGKGEKLGFASLQLSSLVVVLVGAGMAGLVFYSTGTELFAVNSPTRIYDDCVDRVNASEEVRSLIIPPLHFHGANSSNRLRRSRRISSSTSTNGLGQEIMIVRFWVEGTAPPDESETNWMDTLKKWIGPIIFEDSHRPGSYVPTPSIKPSPPLPPPPPPPRTWLQWTGDGFTSLFGSLIPSTGKDGQTVGGEAITPSSMFRRPRRPSPNEFWTGEATAELIKDETTGNFVYSKLYVDIPEARVKNSYRVNIQTADVSDPTARVAPGRIRIWQRTKAAFS